MNRNDRKIAIAALIVAVLALSMLLITGNGTDANRATAAADPVGAASPANNRVTLAGNRATSAARSRAAYTYPTTIVYDEHRDRPAAEVFPFDPNTADSTTLLRLGLSPYLVRSIYRYRARGGVFQRKEDLARMHGLTVGDYQRLSPYIRIGSAYRPAATLVVPDTLRHSVKLAEGEHVTLNTADTAKLQLVPGIGPYFARQILRHGQRLGGYVSVDQLDEIDAFPTQAKRYFVVADAHPVQLNVNRLSLNELRRHPYMGYFRAKAIVDYRRLHGPLHSLDDLRLSRDFPPDVIERLRPYVTF